MKKAGARGADVLVLDLEDGVHPDAKPEARSSGSRRRYRRVTGVTPRSS